jgi:hypothetical protein
MIAMFAATISASAQGTAPTAHARSHHEVMIRSHGEQDAAGAQVRVEAPLHGDGDTFVFVSTEMSMDGKVVKSAPYTAQAVTEMVQTLADGNRIVRKNTANVYRDSQGRTRRDQTLGAIGPFAAAGDPPQTIFINDPVSGVNYILEPRSKTARKLGRLEYKIEYGSKEFEEETQRREKIEKEAAKSLKPGRKEIETQEFTMRVPAPGGPAVGMGPEVHFFGHSSKWDKKTEQLDKRTIEGVEAEGTRTTVTIPAGEVGNEQPIVIVSERWYSADLQTVILTRHSDPRFGENTYRLSNISRSEPDSSLFQVPADYTVKETFMRKPGAMGVKRFAEPQ